MIVSGGQQRDSALHTHVSVLRQTPLPSRLPHNIEQSSLCNTVGPCWLSISNIAVCTCPPKVVLHSFNYFFNMYSRPSCWRCNLCLALHYFSKRGHRDYSFSFFGEQFILGSRRYFSQVKESSCFVVLRSRNIWESRHWLKCKREWMKRVRTSKCLGIEKKSKGNGFPSTGKRKGLQVQ